MSSPFFGLDIGVSALRTAQQLLDTAAHNVANANTPGYSRQTVQVVQAPPYTYPAFNRSGLPGQIGTGVTVASITRVRDTFLDLQMQAQTALNGEWDTRQQELSKVETIFPEPSDSALGNTISKYWAAWQDVSNNPDNLTMRNVLLEKAGSLTEAFNTISSNLSNYRDSVIAGTGPFSGTISSTVDDINSLATKIQNLNVGITRDTAMNVNDNDMLDQRDNLVQELSGKVAITVDTDHTIRIGGEVLVSGDGVTRNDLTVTSSVTPSYSLAGNPVTISGGELNGWGRIVGVVDAVSSDLNTMANQLVTEVNNVHTAGYDLNGNPGVDFFTGTDASGIQVNPALYDPMNPMSSHPEMIAAATTLHDGTVLPVVPNVGDGSNALAIADLASTKIVGLGNQTFDAYFTTIVTGVGELADTEKILADNGQTALDTLKNSIQSESGVNLDEELMDMLAARRAYEASARMATTADSLMDTIINKMG